MSHLTHFGVGNFKVFNELTDFELAPLTILTGKNNSGKSSLLKALLLFKKNLKPNTLQWANNLKLSFEELEFGFPELKLGSSKEVLNFKTKKGEAISFNSSISGLMFPKGKIKLKYYAEGAGDEKAKNSNELFRLKDFVIINDNVPVVSFTSKNGKGNFFKIDFQYFIDRIRVLFADTSNPDWKDFGEKIGLFKKFDWKSKSSKDVESLLNLLNSGQTILGFKNCDIPDEFIKKLNEVRIDIEESDLIKIQSQLIELYQKGIWIKGTDIPGCINQFFSNFLLRLEGQIIEIVNQDEILKLKYNEQILRYGINPILYPFFDYLKILLDNTFNYFVESFENVSYLPSIRAKNERLYWVSKEGYAIQKFDQKTFERIIKNEKIKKFLLDMLRDFEIGDDIKVTTYQRTATEIKINRNDKEKLLSDLGFGYAQLLPIIFTILTTAEKWSYWKYKDEEGYSAIPSPIILIEEPESNLHPNFQAKLADLFVYASKQFGIQFIIETHSEYLIRMLQVLTAKKNIKPEDISIYI